ncbi:MAG: hypothetical protein MUP71_07250 [Candidatus Aminicenantes bacterium]|nr:hypothetical protein [Candidatus Aminicenantes bacterium]
MKPQIQHKKVLFAAALALLTILVYFPSLNHELIWDSKPIIQENALLQGEFSATAPFQSGYWASTSQRDSGYDYYRPMMILSFMMEKAIWGLSPFRLSLLNLLLFVAGLIVLYLLLSRQAAAPGVAETAVVLFALFPLNLDNICWVVGRCDLLMFLFGLLAIYAFDLFLEKRSARYGFMALAAYLFALFSKEASLFFLPVFILLELSRRKRLTLPLHTAFLCATILFWLLKSTVIGRSGIPIHFSPSIWENTSSLLGVMGYYFRSLLFPFKYDMFLAVDAVQTLPYLLSGFLFLLLLVTLPWLGRKMKPVLYAWIWMAPFMAGYLLMVFTPLYPFSISTRYLMIPAIGWVWVLSHLLHGLPAFLRKSLFFMLIVISALAVIGNCKKYSNETAFWKSALHSCPNDSFFLNKYAGQLLQNGDFLGAETNLHHALSFKMKNSTAISIALQLAEIAFEKARYAESLDWLEKIRSLPLTYPQSNRRLFQLLKIHQARDDLAGAETVLQAMVLAAPTDQNKKMRIERYLAFAAWEKAREAAGAIDVPQSGGWLVLVQREKFTFQSLPLKEQSLYFLKRGNFAQAWKLWPKDNLSGVAGQLRTARLAFLAGYEEEGKWRIASLAQEGVSDFRILNSLGNLFFELHRADQALPHYQRSLRLNPDQPALIERVKRIGLLQRRPIVP